MLKKSKFHTIVMLFLLVGILLFGALTPAFAVTSTDVNLGAVSNCTSGYISGSYEITNTTNITGLATDANGTTLDSLSMPLSTIGSTGFGFYLHLSPVATDGDLIGLYATITDASSTAAFFILMRCRETAPSELVYSCHGAVGTCPTTAAEAIAALAEPSTPAASPPDNRLNWGYGDAHIGVLYPSANSLDLYNYATGEYIFGFLTADDLPDTPPVENTIIKQVGNITASILTTGQIQIVMGPDAEGKVYTIFMSDLAGRDFYGDKFDPNE